jgi:hypothetical protein
MYTSVEAQAICDAVKYTLSCAEFTRSSLTEVNPPDVKHGPKALDHITHKQ